MVPGKTLPSKQRDRRQSRKLKFESLQRRQLMAGDVLDRHDVLEDQFSRDGFAEIRFAGVTSVATAAAVQTDGKVVVVGEASGAIGVARFNPDGSSDRSFGDNGSTRFAISGHTGAMDVVVDSKGRIIVAGYAGGDFGVARLLPSGRLDNSFDSNGKQTVNFAGSDEVATKILLDGSGILLVGGGNKDFAAVRLDSRGQVDRTFGTRGTGRVLVNLAAEDIAMDATRLSDGSIVLVGASNGANYTTASDGFHFLGSKGDVGLVRLTSDGRVQKESQFSLEGFDFATSVSRGASDQIYVAAKGGSFGYLLNLDQDLKLNREFDQDGKLRLNDVDIAWDHFLDGEHLVIVGEHNDNISVTHVGVDGQLETNFGDRGTAEISHRSSEVALGLATRGSETFIVGNAGGSGFVGKLASRQEPSNPQPPNPQPPNPQPPNPQPPNPEDPGSDTPGPDKPRVPDGEDGGDGSDGDVGDGGGGVGGGGGGVDDNAPEPPKPTGFDVNLHAGELRITANRRNAHNVIEVSRDGEHIKVYSREEEIGSYEAWKVKKIKYTGQAHIDRFTNRTSLPSVARGGGGNDTLIGGSGNDRLYGGAGRDRLVGGDGNDLLDGGNQADKLLGQKGNDRLLGGRGDDRLQGGRGDDTLEGGPGDDRLKGGKGRDELDGGPGSDVLRPGSQRRTVGAARPTRLDVGIALTQMDLMSAQAINGSTTVETSDEGHHVLMYAPNSGFLGSDAITYVLRDAEGDLMEEEMFVDVAPRVLRLDGTSGNDIGRVSTLGDKVFVELNGRKTAYWHREISRIEFRAAGGNDTFVNSSSIVLHAWGGSGHDRIEGGSNADVIYGQDGNDRLLGHGGNDRMHGGNGNDHIEGGSADDTLLGDDGHDQLYGGSGNDNLRGGTGNDRLDGGDGHDLLHGESGRDALFGGNQNDRLHGGAGRDILHGNNGHDKLYGEGSSDKLYGGAGNDWLHGDAGNDFLNGGNGNDRLWGGDNNDHLIGESGNDQLFGNDGNDRLEGRQGADTLDGGGGHDALFGQLGRDTLYGRSGNDHLDGGGHDDRLYGGNGADYLLGGQGRDLLNGGNGADKLDRYYDWQYTHWTRKLPKRKRFDEKFFIN